MQSGGGRVRDPYLMDGCKLKWHPDRVTDWLDGKVIAPIHIDVGLVKGCNICCAYCFGRLQGNKYKVGAKTIFPREALIKYMKDAGEAGVRSMGFIGEGEPTLNPYLYEAIEVATDNGIDCALGTNGLAFATDLAGERALKRLTWIRFNISACDDESYWHIHRSRDWARFLEVVKFCVYQKRQHNFKVTIGFQSVLIPENVGYMVELAKLGRKMGIDYHVIKQCSDTTASALGIHDKLAQYKSYRPILEEAEAQSTEYYKVIVKWGMIENEGTRAYKQCLGVPFLLYSSGDGKLFPCGMFFDYRSDEFMLGDLTKQSFKDIIGSDKYHQVIEKVRALDVNQCYSNCRTHGVNTYLWDVTHPPEHVNFV